MKLNISKLWLWRFAMLMGFLMALDIVGDAASSDHAWAPVAVVFFSITAVVEALGMFLSFKYPDIYVGEGEDE